MLVDCAGSERKEDSNHHSAERQKEGAEINASIYALKVLLSAPALTPTLRTKIAMAPGGMMFFSAR